MNITEMLGAPVSDPTDAIPGPRGCAISPRPVEIETEPPQGRTQMWLWPVIVVLALAAGYALAVWIRPVVADPPLHLPATIPQPVAAPAISAVAEMATALHLTGLADPAELMAILSETTAATGPTGYWVNRAAAVAVESPAAAQWLVTVAADVLELVDGAYEPAGIQYFEVLVSDGDSPIAVSLPTRIPPPASGAQPAAASFQDPVPIDQEHAVAGFLDAYLTGNGQVARYAAPGARIPLFATPPYTSVAVQHLAADSQGAVRARVAATSRRGTSVTLDYTLDLTFEHGVWEIVAINRVLSSSP
jgi:hypothetical protein